VRPFTPRVHRSATISRAGTRPVTTQERGVSLTAAASNSAAPAGKARVLIYSSLYPSDARPRHGIFLENRVRSLVASGKADVRVVCPVPWFPFKGSWAGEYGAYARTPNRAVRHGIEVRYPRFPLIPRFGMSLAPWSMAAATADALRELQSEGFDFDVLDAYYFYPDGVAAASLARKFRKPLMITAFGTDINLIPQHALPRRMIQWAGARADGITSVCQALLDAMVELGISDERMRVVLHGVDLNLFRPPADRAALRAKLGLTRRTLLSVGHLIERKGHHIPIGALPKLEGVELYIAGDGPEERNLRNLAQTLGVAERVKFLGHVDQTRLPDYFGAADALVLASSREGIANVLLESMACGTPVLATRIWGTPEVVNVPAAGVVLDDRSVASLVKAYGELFAHYPDRAQTRVHAERYTWEQTSVDHLAVMRTALARAAKAAA
jgi:glycosyltransferase involved in cell wall biosynthesis